MADIFDQIQPDTKSKGDIFDQLTSDDYFANQGRATDDSPEMAQAKSDVQGGFVARGLSNFGRQTIINPIVQAINGVTPVINGLNKALTPYEPENPGPETDANIPQIKGPDMTNAPLAAKVLGDVAGGVAQGGAAALFYGGNPIGFIPAMSAISGLAAYGKGQPVAPAAIQGAASAIIPSVAGRIGGSLASTALNKIAPEASNAVKGFIPRFGTAAGMAAAGGATGGVEGAATGATFGALNPMGSPKEVTPEEYNNMVKDNADVYRAVLRPYKGQINDVEMKGNKDLGDIYGVAAAEKLPINRSPQNTIDTRQADGILELKNQGFEQQRNAILNSNPSTRFDLQALASAAKKSLSNQNLSAKSLKAANDDIDSYIDAEIGKSGRFVNGTQLNSIKEGFGNESYTDLRPTSDKSAQALRGVAQDALEKGYENSNLKELNSQWGDYLTLQKILQQAHGQVVPEGNLGKIIGRETGKEIGAGIGGLGGMVLGHGNEAAAIPGAMFGTWAGGKIGEAVNWRQTDLSRITQKLADRLNNVKVINPQAQGEYIPPSGNTGPRPSSPIDVQPIGPQAIGFNPRLGIRQYDYGPNDLRAGGFQKTPTGQAVSSNPIAIPKFGRSESARYTGGIGLPFNRFGKMIKNRRTQ